MTWNKTKLAGYLSIEHQNVVNHSFVEKIIIIWELICNWNAATCLYATWWGPRAITVDSCKTWM